MKRTAGWLREAFRFVKWRWFMVILAVTLFYWPISTIESIYTGNSLLSAPITIGVLALLYLVGIYPIGLLHISLWIWGAIAIYLHGAAAYIAITYYVLMAISVFWIATLWWDDEITLPYSKRGGKNERP